MVCGLEEITQISFKEFSEYDFLQVLLLVHPGIRSVVIGPNRVFYEVDDIAAKNIAVSAHGNPETLELLLDISCANLWNAKPIPEAFRPICFSLLQGKSVGAKRTGPKSGKDFGLFIVAVWAAEQLSDIFDIPLTRGDGMEHDSAADVVSIALAARGVTLKYTRIRDWLTNGKHKRNRDRANIIANQYNENLLISLGLVRRRETWVAGRYPCGQSPIIGRIT